MEAIRTRWTLIISTEVGDEPNPYEIPASVTPAWKYITAIECNGVAIPKEYFTNAENWELSTTSPINGTFTHINLYISQELIDQLLVNKDLSNLH